MQAAERKISNPNESLILVNSHDQVIGHETKEKCHQGNGLLHRAFSIFIFNDKKELLLQKRSSEKLLWPLHWSNSVCSHPRKGEEDQEASRRRLVEELGFHTQLQFLFKFQYHAKFKDIGSENELCSVYLGKINSPRVVQADYHEIAEWKFVALDNLNEDIRNHPHKFTPWFKLEWQRIQDQHEIEIKNLLNTSLP